MPFNSQFTPTDGLLNTSSYPAQPASEEAARQQFMDLFNLLLGNDNFLDSALAGKAIVESGSNANGKYVKFGDGTLICYMEVSVTSAVTTAMVNGGYRSGGFNNTYPATFYSRPVLSSSLTALEPFCAIYPLASNETTTCVAIVKSINSITVSATYTVQVKAIGRWKA